MAALEDPPHFALKLGLVPLPRFAWIVGQPGSDDRNALPGVISGNPITDMFAMGLQTQPRMTYTRRNCCVHSRHSRPRFLLMLSSIFWNLPRGSSRLCRVSTVRDFREALGSPVLAMPDTVRVLMGFASDGGLETTASHRWVACSGISRSSGSRDGRGRGPFRHRSPEITRHLWVASISATFRNRGSAGSPGFRRRKGLSDFDGFGNH